MLKLFAAFVVYLVAADPACAHFYAEPGFGIEAGKTTQGYASPTFNLNTGDNAAGYTFGIGAGYRYNFIYAGAQYEKSLGGQITDISATLGYNIMMRWRIWGSYIFSARDDISKGTGYKIGTGLALFKLISINAEFVSRHFNQYRGPFAVPSLTYSGNAESVKLTLTFPSPRPLDR